MKNTLTILIFTLLTSFAFTQNRAINDEIYAFVEVEAEYPGGNKALIKFLAKNIRYPNRAVREEIEGKLVVRFVINQKGKVAGAKIQQGMPSCPECEKEALRVVNKMPKWKPATVKGEKVKAYFDLPISFRLN